MHNGNGARLDNERARGRPHAVSHWRRHLDVRHDTRVAPCIGLMHHCPPSRTCAGLHTHSRPILSPAPPDMRLRNTPGRAEHAVALLARAPRALPTSLRCSRCPLTLLSRHTCARACALFIVITCMRIVCQGIVKLALEREHSAIALFGANPDDRLSLSLSLSRIINRR